MNADTTDTTPALEGDELAAALERYGTARTLRFAEVEHSHDTPRRFIGEGRSRRQWLALSVDERRALIVTLIARDKAAQRAAEQAAEALSKDPRTAGQRRADERRERALARQRELLSGRRAVLACATGCGAWCPAPSLWRAAVRRCEDCKRRQ